MSLSNFDFQQLCFSGWNDRAFNLTDGNQTSLSFLNSFHKYYDFVGLQQLLKIEHQWIIDIIYLKSCQNLVCRFQKSFLHLCQRRRTRRSEWAPTNQKVPCVVNTSVTLGKKQNICLPHSDPGSKHEKKNIFYIKFISVLVSKYFHHWLSQLKIEQDKYRHICVSGAFL